MAKLSADATLFGLDLGQAQASLRQAWGQMPLVQWLARATPPTAVQWWPLPSPEAAAATTSQSSAAASPSTQALLRGAQYLGLQEQPSFAGPSPKAQAGKGSKSFSAVLLHTDSVLTRRLQLPRMGAAELQDAIALQALGLSPFAPEDSLVAHQAQLADDPAQGWQVQLVLASRQQVQRQLQPLLEQQRLPVAPEVWADTPGGPILCPGWGEAARLRHEAAQRRRLLLGAALVAGLLLAVVVSPTLQLRARSWQADRQVRALHSQTQEVAAQRQSLMAQVQALGSLQAELEQQVDHLQVLEALTRILPDDTTTQRITIEGLHLNLQGLSDNAAQVQQLLSQDPGFRSVRLPAAVTRDAKTGKENFVMEAELNPANFALWSKPSEAAQP